MLSSLEDQVERHLSLAVEKYQNLAVGELSRHPANGGWSIAECLWHLNSYGNHYLPEIQKGLDKSTTAATSFDSTWLGAYFTRMMKPGPKMTKMKAFKDHRPPVELEPHVVVAAFIQQQELLLKLLRRARMADMNRIRIGISIMPWLKLRLGDVFQFLVAHQERHVVQAERVGRSPDQSAGEGEQQN